jgi:hypothetical protein
MHDLLSHSVSLLFVPIPLPADFEITRSFLSGDGMYPHLAEVVPEALFHRHASSGI